MDKLIRHMVLRINEVATADLKANTNQLEAKMPQALTLDIIFAQLGIPRTPKEAFGYAAAERINFGNAKTYTSQFEGSPITHHLLSDYEIEVVGKYGTAFMKGIPSYMHLKDWDNNEVDLHYYDFVISYARKKASFVVVKEKKILQGEFDADRFLVSVQDLDEKIVVEITREHLLLRNLKRTPDGWRENPSAPNRIYYFPRV